MRWLKRIFGEDRHQNSAHLLSGMVFKSPLDFFEYQCQFGDTRMRYGVPCYAFVDDDITEMAARAMGEAIEDPDERVLQIRIASKDGGLARFVPHNLRRGLVRPGDLVAWAPLVHRNKKHDDGWDGALIALCAPEFNDHGVKVITYF